MSTLSLRLISSLIPKDLDCKDFKKAQQKTHADLNNVDSLDQSNEAGDLEKLFRLQAKMGNSWTPIAEHFTGKTPNQIKNLFFSAIRKGIRRSSKYSQKKLTAKMVNELKPKILCKFMESNLSLPNDIYRPDPNFSWSLTNPICVLDFLKFFITEEEETYKNYITQQTRKIIIYILSKVKSGGGDHRRRSQVKRIKALSIDNNAEAEKRKK